MLPCSTSLTSKGLRQQWCCFRCPDSACSTSLTSKGLRLVLYYIGFCLILQHLPDFKGIETVMRVLLPNSTTFCSTWAGVAICWVKFKICIWLSLSKDVNIGTKLYLVKNSTESYTNRKQLNLSRYYPMHQSGPLIAPAQYGDKQFKQTSLMSI